MAEKRKIYHVSKRESDGKWAIHIQGSDNVFKTFNTKAEAETYCETLGANQKGTVLFHNSKGKAKGSIKTTQVHTKESVKAAKVETKSAAKKIETKSTKKAETKTATKKADTKATAKTVTKKTENKSASKPVAKKTTTKKK